MKTAWRPNAVEAGAACALTAVLLLGLMAQELPQLVLGDTSRDFSLLYRSAERARLQQAVYADPDPAVPSPLLNFNPPHLHAILLPLTFFDVRVAYVLWALVSFALLLLIVHVTVTESRAPKQPAGFCLLVAGIAGSVGFAATVRMGQISMWVALLVTLSWRAARQGRSVPAGVWLGLAVSVKPFLLLGVPVLLARRRTPAALVAVVTASMALAMGGLWLGWSNFSNWLDVLQSPRRATTFALNASVWGVIARAGLPETVAVAASAAIAAFTLWRVRSADEDSSWVMWISASLLCSPLGWVYYLPLLIGPLGALAFSGGLPRGTWYIAPAFLPPPLSLAVLQAPRILAVSVGSIYFWGLAVLWGTRLGRNQLSTADRESTPASGARETGQAAS